MAAITKIQRQRKSIRVFISVISVYKWKAYCQPKISLHVVFNCLPQDLGKIAEQGYFVLVSFLTQSRLQGLSALFPACVSVLLLSVFEHVRDRSAQQPQLSSFWPEVVAGVVTAVFSTGVSTRCVCVCISIGFISRLKVFGTIFDCLVCNFSKLFKHSLVFNGLLLR